MPKSKATDDELRQRIVERSLPEPNTGCWLWISCHKKNGYGYMWAWGKKEHAHRVSQILFNNPIPKNLNVLHKCDQPACVNPSHLFLGTQSDNLLDCVKKGRHKIVAMKGESNAKAKLTDDDIYQIRMAAKRPGYLYELSEKYGVSRGTICNVRGARTWRHIV